MGNISSALYISSSIINQGRADAVGASGLYAVTEISILSTVVQRQELESSYPCAPASQITHVNCCATAFINAISLFQKEIKTTNNLKDLKEKYFLKMKNLNIKVGDGMKGLRLSLTSEISGADLFTIIEILNIEIINYRLTNSLKIMYDKSRDN